MTEKPEILIVDDEPFYLEVLDNLLREEYRTRIANDGPQALKIATAKPPPDLILLDIMMQGMDGYEVCRQLKANPVSQSVPVIFLTVKRDVEDEVLGFNLGAVDYITKPISPPIVRARVRTHIEISRLKKQLEQHHHC